MWFWLMFELGAWLIRIVCQLDIVSAFQSYGERIYDRITEDERKEIVRYACPGPGACGGMYTANTMATGLYTILYSSVEIYHCFQT